MLYKKVWVYNLFIFLFIFSACSPNNSKSSESSSISESKKVSLKSDSSLNINSSDINSVKVKQLSETKKYSSVSESSPNIESTTITNKGKEAEPYNNINDKSSKKKKLEFINSYTTNFDNSKDNRVFNIKLASEKINGIIVEAGEVFSFNEIVGAMGAEQGFKKAVTFSQGKEVEGYGGGICQISTTILNAVKSLDVEIVEQHHHSHEVPYAKKGEDAAIVYGSEDFKFKNLNSYPLQINIKVKKSTLTVSISKVIYE